MTIKINSSDKIIIDSGIFITYNNEKNILSLNYLNETLNFELNFVKDINSKETRVEYKPKEDGSALIINLVNFNNPIGNALKEAVEVATIKNNPIYLQLWINSIDENIKQVTYTFYTRGENGK